jgi:hypothetical protein
LCKKYIHTSKLAHFETNVILAYHHLILEFFSPLIINHPMLRFKYILLLVLASSPFISSSYAQGVKATFTPSARFFPGYGSVSIGKTKDQIIKIYNDSTSTGALNCSVIGPAGANYSIVGSSSFSVDIGQTYSLTIRFQPLASGLLRDTIYITHNADTSTTLKNPVRYAFSGTGIAPDTFPKITVSGGSFLNFGNVTIGKASSLTFTIKNVSDTTRTLIGSIINPLKTSYSILSGGGNFSLDTGKTSVVTVNFSPDSSGQIFDSVIVLSNAGSPNNRIRVFLFGTGVKPTPFPKITIVGGGFNGINFGYDTVGHPPRTATVTITNTSDSARILIGNVVAPNSPFSIISGGGSFSLDSGKSMTVQLELNSLTSGTFKDSLVITSNSDSADQTKKIYLNGTAGAITGPHISVKPATLNFGTVSLNASNVSMTSTITNSGGISTDILNDTVSIPSAPFSITSGSGINIVAMNDSLHITVQLTPNTLGTFRDSVVITSNSNDNSKRLVIHLTANVIFLGGVKDENVSMINFIEAIPNPFTRKSMISFFLEETSSVILKIYDMLGKVVYTSPENIYSSGMQQVEFNAGVLPDGAYLCQLQIGKEIRTIRVVLAK